MADKKTRLQRVQGGEGFGPKGNLADWEINRAKVKAFGDLFVPPRYYSLDNWKSPRHLLQEIEKLSKRYPESERSWLIDSRLSKLTSVLRSGMAKGHWGSSGRKRDSAEAAYNPRRAYSVDPFDDYMLQPQRGNNAVVKPKIINNKKKTNIKKKKEDNGKSISSPRIDTESKDASQMSSQLSSQLSDYRKLRGDINGGRRTAADSNGVTYFERGVGNNNNELDAMNINENKGFVQWIEDKIEEKLGRALTLEDPASGNVGEGLFEHPEDRPDLYGGGMVKRKRKTRKPRMASGGISKGKVKANTVTKRAAPFSDMKKAWANGNKKRANR